MVHYEYRDVVLYSEKVIEAAWRRGSIEVNEAMSNVVGARVFSGGRWFIASKQEAGVSKREILELIKRISSTAPVSWREGLCDAELYTGSVSLGEESGTEELLGVLKKIVSMLSSGEVIVTQTTLTRTIERKESSCSEKKNIIEVTVYVEHSEAGKRSVASFSMAYTGSVGELRDDIIYPLVKDASERARAQARAKALSPLYYGKWVLVLDYEVSAALFHELAHLLEADQPESLPVGSSLGCEWLSIHDDPFYPWSPAMRFFDDEGVKCVRKELVSEGTVVEHLHTRVTAQRALEKRIRARPGQSRGLFHPPKAMHSTLVVSPGDWRLQEIIEETREGILIRGLVRAELQGGIVTIIPENAWLIKKGEVKEPIYISCVKVPLLQALKTVDAVTYTTRMRHGYEKGHVVAEVAPAVRIQGYATGM